MQIKNLKAKKLHGFLDVDINFNSSLTFVTGINGSGKTSAINAIVALIGPDLQLLTNIDFQEIKLLVVSGGREFTIYARSKADIVYLSINKQSETFSYRKFYADFDLPSYKKNEVEVEHYRNLLSENMQNEVIKTIHNLPSPMFLGVDRRSKFDVELASRRMRSNPVTRSSRNLFGASLTQSLGDASWLAEVRNRDILIESGKIGEELKREMLVSMLAMPSEIPGSTFSVPSDKEIRDLLRVKIDIDVLSKIFDIPIEEINEKLNPIINELENISKNLPKISIGEDDFNKNQKKYINAVVNWNSYSNQIFLLKLISKIGKKYNDKRKALLKPIENYVSLLNSFFIDSGKVIGFDDKGYIFVSIKGSDTRNHISLLSSGEAQLFVILTHLCFNPLAQNANVFIIDEPELSLHIKWQENFVDSVMKANPNIQYIMATHSPSIILDKMQHCVDVSGI